jgi:6-phosphofructokinase 1
MRPYGRAPDRWHRETGPRGRRRADLRATGSLRSHRTACRGDRQSDRALLETQRIGNTLRLAHQLEQLTGLESRVSILGYIQRGGTPSPVDRLLATRLGSAAADLVHAGTFGVMVAARGDGTAAVPLEEVAGRRKIVPLDHTWIATARHVGTCLGD